MQVELNDDIAAKIEDSINGMLFKKHDGIKLSEIFKAYRDWVNADKDHDEKVEREFFTCEVEEEDKSYVSSYTYFRVKFHDEALDRHSNRGKNVPDIEFLISQSQKDKPGEIYHIRLEGSYADDKFSLRHITSIEALILNLYYNHTPIILDLDDIDNDDNQYDYELD